MVLFLRISIIMFAAEGKVLVSSGNCLLKFVKNILSLSVSVARNNDFTILSSRAAEKTNSKKMAKTETAVQIEKDIEDLSSMEKFDEFINLVNYYHLYCCKIEKCNNCYFLCNLRYMFKI